MAKILLHDVEAGAALGWGGAQRVRAVRGRFGTTGMSGNSGNSGISGMALLLDRPLGPPWISRDGAGNADEIELEEPFENIRAQAWREGSQPAHPIAGNGTTPASVLGAELVQQRLAALAGGATPAEQKRRLHRIGDASNAVRAGLILTTQTRVASQPDIRNPTASRADGGAVQAQGRVCGDVPAHLIFHGAPSLEWRGHPARRAGDCVV